MNITMDNKQLIETIQSLKDANDEYENKILHNHGLILKNQWDLYYKDIHEKQMEIINKAIDKDVYVFIFSVPHDPNAQEYEEPVDKGFVLNKMDQCVWIAKLKSQEFSGFKERDDHSLIGLTDVYYIDRSDRLDEGHYKVSYREHDNWGTFSVDRFRLNIFNVENFRDKDVLRYLNKIFNLKQIFEKQ